MRLFIGSCVSLTKQYVKSVVGCDSQPCVVCFHGRPAFDSIGESCALDIETHFTHGFKAFDYKEIATGTMDSN